MEMSGYTVEVDEDGVCLLRSPWDPRLRRLIRAIPGRFWDEDLHAWTIRLTPDRAESIARLLRTFPVFEEVPGALEAIEHARDRRNLRKPLIEGVTPDEEYSLSFCDDWVHPVLDEVRRFFRPRPYPEIGRLSVPVTDETRNPLLTLIERNNVGLHIRARQRLAPEPAPGAPTRRSAITGLPQRSMWRGWVSTTITDDLPYFVFATRGGIPPQELYDAGGVRQMGEVALVPMDGRRKPHVEELLVRNRQILADPRVYLCLDHLSEDRPDDPPPPAVVTIVRDPETGTYEFVVQVLWDDTAIESLTLLPESRALRARDDGDGDAEGEGGAVVADAATVPAVSALVNEHGLGMDDESQRLLEELLAEHAHGQELVALSQAHVADFDPPPGLHGTLMPFQTAGVVYALRQRRTFIADEQGLGKTIEALAAIESADAYPAVVVCPASLKLNWLRAGARWLSARRAEPLGGRRGALPRAAPAGGPRRAAADGRDHRRELRRARRARGLAGGARAEGTRAGRV